jgi:hypothetical protein
VDSVGVVGFVDFGLPASSAGLVGGTDYFSIVAVVEVLGFNSTFASFFVT